MPTMTVDLDRLATYLQNKIDAEKLSVRSAAKKIDIGASTLARLLQGKSNENIPDLDVIDKAARWVGRSVADFAMPQKAPTSTISDVEVHLRALPGLGAADVDALVAMVKAGYERAKKLRAQKN